MENLIIKYKKYNRKQCLKIFNDIIDKKVEDSQFKLMSYLDIYNLQQDPSEGVVLANVIVREKDLPSFQEKKKIVLQNCVIIGNLQVYDAKEIVIQNCFVFGSLNIWADLCLLSIEETMIDAIVLRFGKYHVCGNCVSMGTLSSEVADVTLGYLMCCCIRSFLMKSSDVILGLMSYTKFEIGNSLSGKFVGEWKNFPTPFPKILSSDIDLKEYPRGNVCDLNQKYNNIFDFFEKNGFCVTVDDFADLIYYKNKQGLKGLKKRLYEFWGGMIKPHVIFGSFVEVWIGFAIIYFVMEKPFFSQCAELCGANFFVKKSFFDILMEELFESLYFSAVTLTTVGYGDVVPCGIARFWASIEGIVGVVMGGAFLLAFTRKYFERHNNEKLKK